MLGRQIYDSLDSPPLAKVEPSARSNDVVRIQRGEGIGDLYINAWAPLVPALVILVTILGLNMFTDGMQDALNPTTREP